MLESLLQYDKRLLIFLNNLGNEQWDGFWLAITNQLNWIPLFVFIFYLSFRIFGFKKGLFLVVSMIVLVAFSDQFTNLIKDTIMRLRPNNDTSINHLLRRFINPQSYSFISGHATTSTAFSVFILFLFREKLKYIKWILLFPLVFAYSRLYLGVHFPIDIFCGILTGTTIGILYYKGVILLENRLFKNTI